MYETCGEDGRKQFVYLLDEALHMDTVVQKFGEKLVEEEKALIRDYEMDAIEGGREVAVLFEEADGIFLYLQGKDRPKHMSGKEIKVSTCYEGWNARGELVGKVMSAGFEDGRTFQKLREATIKKKYNTDEVKLRVLNGDGAGWVKACEDPDTVFQLDRFHICQKKGSWSIAGGGHMAKILVRFANRSIWEDISRYKDTVIESDKEPVILDILSAARAPKIDGKGNKTGNVMTGHIMYREAKMTFSRKAFLKIFDNKEFTQLVYR